MMLRHITISLVGLLLSCSFSMANELIGFQFKKNQRSESFDIEVVNNLVIVPVVLNKILNLKLILDTGVRNTILFDHELGNLFFIDPHRTVTILGLGDGDEIEASIATLIEMQIGGLKAENKGLLILPEGAEHEIEKYLGVEVHGLIGFDLFKDIPIRIDYAKERLTLYNPKFWKGRKRRFEKVPLNIRDGKPYIRVNAKDQDESCEQCEVLIDSGSALGLTFNSFADRKLNADQPSVNVSLGSGLAGDLSGKMSRVSSLDIGDTTFKNLIGSFPAEASVRFLEDKKEQSGSIGGEILNRFVCIYDYQNATLLLRKTPRVRKAFRFSNTGLQLRNTDNLLSTVEVDRVVKGTPAHEIGLQAGDIILAIQGLDSKSMTLREALATLEKAKNGKKLNLLIQRGSDIFHVTLRTREVI